MSSSEPRVTIGVPVYNAERHIPETLDALVAQSYTNVEIVISDNASTDRTEAICRSFARADRRVVYHRNTENVGIYANYTKLMQFGTGSLFKWASANDWVAPTFVESCVNVLLRRPDVILSYPQTKLFADDLDASTAYDDVGSLEDDSPTARLLTLLQRIRLNNVMNGVIRRDALTRTRLHEPYHSSDIVMLCELALMGKFVQVPEPLYYRRMTPEASTKLMQGPARDRYIFGGKRNSGRPWLRRWRFLGLAVRARLDIGERLKLVSYLAKHTYWEAEKLLPGFLVGPSHRL
jgi:glycosyltransferase involved in cell wall biosynthesis